jgi:inner membrane protein YidH
VSIRNFSDHAANERTFLAWVRTGIAIMAFGFLVERFDIFLKIAASSMAPHQFVISGQAFGRVAGLSLIVAGALLIFLSALRFRKTSRAIESSETRSAPGTGIDLVLAAMFAVLGIALVVYLTHALS